MFADISVSVPQGARIALVGANGIGKSTLLRLLAGFERPDQGTLHTAKGLVIGYLPQELKEDSEWEEYLDLPVEAFCLTAFKHLNEMEAKLNELERSMADPHQAEGVIERYGSLQEQYELAGGYTYRADSQRVLRGLGFDADQFGQPLGTLSGGERTRASLARLLLQDSDLLVLDEPTNHLDIEAVTWLEGWLNDWPGAALIVSHDRYFLDQTVDMVWELAANGLHQYRGNYSAFSQQREERLARHEKTYQAQQDQIRKEKDFIQRNIAGQNTRQAQGRRTRLTRFMQEEALDPLASQRSMAIAFEAEEDAGQTVLETDGLVIGHEQPLFSVPDLKLRRSERAALIGPNGAGKSTFLKTLVGQMKPRQGQVSWGNNVSIGYFAQAHEGLDASDTVLESLLSVDSTLKISQAREVLGRYLFSGDEVHKKVTDLSGGERGRLALAQLAQQGSNFLLLDEPTNHLDLTSQEILQSALATFPGTLLIASHDRYLIQALASQIWFVHPEAEQLQRVQGGYDEFLIWRRGWEQSRETASPKPTRKKQSLPGGSRKSLARRLERIELQVTELERKMASLAAKIEHGGQDHERLVALGGRYEALEKELKEHLFEWERLSEELERP